ncbi:uncharacterized protein LOC136016551 [Lathamus discolor]|uniref:uncharacterized protein LOC136016551 n=1 Tax=Lathamus discolor TaxID=678569 RepID=UPI0032B7F200
MDLSGSPVVPNSPQWVPNAPIEDSMPNTSPNGRMVAPLTWSHQGCPEGVLVPSSSGFVPIVPIVPITPHCPHCPHYPPLSPLSPIVPIVPIIPHCPHYPPLSPLSPLFPLSPQGYEIHVTPSVRPEPEHMKDIITCSGGTFLPTMPSTYRPRCVVVSCPADAWCWAPALSSRLPLASPELLLTGLLRQRLQLQPFLLPPPTENPPPNRGPPSTWRRPVGPPQ